jgi:hypothetical protein
LVLATWQYKQQGKTNNMAYNLDYIKAKLNGKASFSDRKKMTYWKTEMGDHDVRILPYSDTHGQPCQEVVYYTKLDEFTRFVAPHIFGLEDPIHEFKQDLFERKLPKEDPDRKLFSVCSTKQRYYFLLIDRAHEEIGPQVWEVSDETAGKIFGILAHKDYENENLFDPDTGYDFTVSVKPEIKDGKPKLFNGRPCKVIEIQPRRKPSKLNKDSKVSAQWIQDMPNLEAFLKAQVKTPEKMQELLEAAIVNLRDKLDKKTPESAPAAGDELDAAFGTL